MCRRAQCWRDSRVPNGGGRNRDDLVPLAPMGPIFAQTNPIGIDDGDLAHGPFATMTTIAIPNTRQASRGSGAMYGSDSRKRVANTAVGDLCRLCDASQKDTVGLIPASDLSFAVLAEHGLFKCFAWARRVQHDRTGQARRCDCPNHSADDQPNFLHFNPIHSVAGFSRSPLIRCTKTAASWPSTMRWSKLEDRFIILRTTI